MATPMDTAHLKVSLVLPCGYVEYGRGAEDMSGRDPARKDVQRSTSGSEWVDLCQRDMRLAPSNSTAFEQVAGVPNWGYRAPHVTFRTP